ncbi:MAG TPA: hypothetical protein VFD86_01335, partial [Nitrospira sp.]|nr:hypothetical protein [Nitrospira sp.]
RSVAVAFSAATVEAAAKTTIGSQRKQVLQNMRCQDCMDWCVKVEVCLLRPHARTARFGAPGLVRPFAFFAVG